MKEIQLAGGQITLVDEDLFEDLNRYRWRLDCHGYVIRTTTRQGKTLHFRMHRVINGTPDGLQTDHINGDKLDNRRANLRSCTRSVNNQNKRGYGVSKYRGVSFSKIQNRWKVAITVNQKEKWLGNFRDEVEAAKAYDKAAVEFFGPGCALNFPIAETAKIG